MLKYLSLLYWRNLLILFTSFFLNHFDNNQQSMVYLTKEICLYRKYAWAEFLHRQHGQLSRVADFWYGSFWQIKCKIMTNCHLNALIVADLLKLNEKCWQIIPFPTVADFDKWNTKLCPPTPPSLTTTGHWSGGGKLFSAYGRIMPSSPLNICPI